MYSGRCGCPSGISLATGPRPGDGLPKRMLRAVLGRGEFGGVIEVFRRGEDAGEVKASVSRRQLDTLELERREDERCLSAGMRRLWRRHGVEEWERGAESSEGGRSQVFIMATSPFNIRPRGPGKEGEPGVRGRELRDVGEGESRDVRAESGGVVRRGSGVVIDLPPERAAAI